MCSRFSQPHQIALKAAWDKIKNPKKISLEGSPRYNVAPTDEATVIALTPRGLEVDRMLFGMVPHWAKDMKMGLNCINARSETISEKPSFRKSFREKRCVIPADGFFEWKREGAKKWPYRFVPQKGNLFSLAGLWDEWISPHGHTIHSFCVITTEPNSLLAQIHDRMPVILNEEQEKEWLNPTLSDERQLKSLLTILPSDDMTSYRVSEWMNASRNKGEKCIQPLEAGTSE